jgi:DNA polymerase
MPGELRAAIAGGCIMEAHNYSFELAHWQNIMVRRYDWQPVKPEQWRDTMAAASYYAMPAKLDGLLRALHMPGKNAEGGRLISKYSKLYLKTSQPVIPAEDNEKWIQYCKEDVLREEQVSDYLGDLPDRELPVFLLDQEINLRGLKLDQEGIAAASLIVEQRAFELIDRFRALTGLNPSQNAKVLEWAEEHGVELENMQADYLEGVLEADLPSGPVRDALTIRLKVNKASTKKLDAMARQSGSDGRARWQQRYHGAQTGRQTGSGFQPLNLTKGYEDIEPEMLVRDIMRGDPAWLDLVYGDATDAVSKASRHWIMAEKGHQIYAGDFVSIEAVILACLAGEDWKVEAFRAGAKIYELMGDKIHGLPEGTVTKATHPKERQDGKTGELAFGYQGALNAWLKFDDSGRHSDERIIEICKAWRAAHPAVVAFWADLEEAAIDAVKSPGEYVVAGESPIAFQIVDEWLSMILPNGKRIWYREPELRVQPVPWHHCQDGRAARSDCKAGTCSHSQEQREACNAGTCGHGTKVVLRYWTQKSGQWQNRQTYGGKLAENACQATSREYLLPSMRNVRKHGYPIILSVYDEIVCEVPDGHGSKAEFEELLANAPGREWAVCADGQPWPIRVDGWLGKRYRK